MKDKFWTWFIVVEFFIGLAWTFNKALCGLFRLVGYLNRKRIERKYTKISLVNDEEEDEE